MKPTPLSIAAVLLLAAPAAAAEGTVEQKAWIAGSLHEQWERVRFVCLAEGIPMPTFAEKHGADLNTTVMLMEVKYPDYYRAGARKGVAEVNELIGTSVRSKMLPKLCETFKNG
ncbi:hypothetical protein ABIF96_003092 [Bradyrhizobium ottawaense]|uniref:hypothetical protein n=1 Tax=Bradyrhizobium ottawaense TaxID=931866 RepID=UPI0038374433